MHIKFLDHGKGSPAKASAYLLDELDHMGVVRAGVEVLRGDATTFNAVCDASPHLWKYTSGVIAWSKEDDPTSEQIKEVLDEFEKHAFAGLDPSQYHLFAVLHTDDDGSKHIHVLAPRLDIQSGKSLNIAPPGHEKHFDSVRDYFNTKYQWSRPDDLLLMQTTQEPNHIAKLNAQAKNILTSQDLETLTKKQFCKTVDNYVQTLLKTQTAENRADIVECIEQVKGVESVKQSKEFLTVTLSNGKKHRLKGDFYNEQFEIGLYSERLRAEAESRPTANELAQAIRDAKSVRDDYRAKREAYHSKQHTFTASTADDNSPQIASKLDIDRNRQSITPSHKRDDSELQGANRRIIDSASEYRYYGNIKSEIEHRFVFNINSGSTEQNQQPVAEHLDRQTEFTTEHTITSTASDSKPKRADRERNTNADHRKTEYAKSKIHFMRDDLVWTADLFNSFLSGLSSPYKLEDHRSATTNYSTELRSNHGPNQLFEHPTEVSHADRDRPIFNGAKLLIESTKQIVSGTKRLIDATSRLIKERLELLRQAESRLEQQNQQLGNRERNEEGINFSDEIGAFKTRTRQIFGGISAKIIKQLEQSISEAMDASLGESGFNRKFQEFCASRNDSIPNRYEQAKDRDQERSLENIADACSERLQRRIADDKQASRFAREKSDDLQRVNLELEQLEMSITNIRLKPKPATDFSRLRYDGYYPDYVISHRELAGQQEYAYQNKRTFDVIHIIKKKSEKLMNYISQARKMLNSSDYQLIKEIIKNDERMLRYLKCDDLLEPQNGHFKDEKASYLSCIQNFKEIRSTIDAVTSPQPKSPEREVVERSNQPEPTLTPEQKNDFNFDF